MRKEPFIALMICILPGASFDETVCENRGELKTPLGTLDEQVCKTPNRPGSSTHQFLLAKKTILSGPYPMMFSHGNKNNSLMAIQGPPDPELSCSSQIFLIDLTSTKPHVYAFGIKNACAEYHWASWGKKRSVIAIKDNIRFTYSNGNLSSPPDDFGDGTPLSRRFPEDGKSLRMWPFVEELPIP